MAAIPSRAAVRQITPSVGQLSGTQKPPLGTVAHVGHGFLKQSILRKEMRMGEAKGAVNTRKEFATKSLPNVPNGDSRCRTHAGRVTDVPRSGCPRKPT